MNELVYFGVVRHEYQDPEAGTRYEDVYLFPKSHLGPNPTLTFPVDRETMDLLNSSLDVNFAEDFYQFWLMNSDFPKESVVRFFCTARRQRGNASWAILTILACVLSGLWIAYSLGRLEGYLEAVKNCQK